MAFAVHRFGTDSTCTRVTNRNTNLLGIYDATNMVFFAGIIFLIIIIFGLTMSISRNSDRVRQLAQSMALQDYENRNK